MSRSSEEARQWMESTDDNDQQEYATMGELYAAIEHETNQKENE